MPEVTLQQIRAVVNELRKVTVEVFPGFWVTPEAKGPKGTIRLGEDQWRAMVELAERLAPPASMEPKKAGDAGSAGESQ